MVSVEQNPIYDMPGKDEAPREINATKVFLNIELFMPLLLVRAALCRRSSPRQTTPYGRLSF